MFYIPHHNPFIHPSYQLPNFLQNPYPRNHNDLYRHPSRSFSFYVSHSPLNLNILPLNPFYIRPGLFDRPEPFFINRMPVHHHTNCHLRQDAQKAHHQATEIISCHLKLLDCKNTPRLPEEPCLGSVQVKTPVLVPQSDEESLLTKKNFALSMNLIDTAYQTFTASYAELGQKNGSAKEYSDILAVRKNFWEQQQTKAFETKDFDALNAEIKKQEVLDFYLIVLLEHQVNQAKKLNTNLQSHLGILSSLNDHEAFTVKIRKATSEIHHPIPSDAELMEIKENIALVLITAEKHANTAFLDTLCTHEKEFAEDGYTSVAAHYSKTISQFQRINKKEITQENVDAYIAEWNALLKEFDPQHQFLLTLKDAEQALKNCSIQFGEWVFKNSSEGKKDLEILVKKFNDQAAFFDKKSSLSQYSDIDAFIKKIYAFIKTAEAKMA